MLQRAVITELLDHLSVDDPHAIRSRRHLSLINFSMGNERWIIRALAQFPQATRYGIVELGVGDRCLRSVLVHRFSESSITAFDLAHSPSNLAAQVKWQCSELFAHLPLVPGGVRIANSFLHHFDGDALAPLGRWVANADLAENRRVCYMARIAEHDLLEINLPR